MKKEEAIQYILSKQGFVPYFTMISSYGENDEIPEDLINLCLNKVNECEIKVTNPELSKIISNG